VLQTGHDQGDVLEMEHNQVRRASSRAWSKRRWLELDTTKGDVLETGHGQG
jgi:hypothetical protein